MPRKPAPQPLALEHSAVRSISSDSRPVPVTETVSNPNSASDQASPRSPRSPVRRGQKTPDSTEEAPLQLANVLHQSETSPRENQRPYQQQQQQQPSPSHKPDQLFHQQHQQQNQIESQQQPEQRSLTTPRGRPPGQHHLGHKSRHDEDKTSKSGFFFSFGKSSKSSDRAAAHQHTNSRADIMSKDADRPSLAKQSTKVSDSEVPSQRSNTPGPSRSELSLASSSTDNTDLPSNHSGTTKKSKSKPFNLLSRSRSINKEKDGKDAPSPKEQPEAPTKGSESDRLQTSAALKTAPLQTHDRSFREMMSSAVRHHSADRSQGRDGGKGRDKDQEKEHKDKSLQKEGVGSFLSSIKHSKAANFVSSRLFGTSLTREPAPPKEPEVDDEHYVLKVINLPLVEQTRLTRISKRLEHSRDKTEFWMPAFPWRAIDYLNYKGTDVEGLYRVPGSGPQIKKWQRKFDEELDVDLFEQPDLYDINIIGSMLKAWLRELPDEIFPKEAQERIARECAGSETVPELLVEELSNLPPFNYYLLFAITCHLSLLLAHSDKNKMDFRNLCICFQPCMKIDSFCFKFLVCNWRECWKGCKNEAKYIEEEYRLFEQPPPTRALIPPKPDGEEERQQQQPQPAPPPRQEERNLSSSDSGRSGKSGSSEGKGRLKKKLSEGDDTGAVKTTTLTIDPGREITTKTGELRPLSPIKPLSPLNF